jgi:metal-responsive CopG/Arc/MetJ family transcriptional regulator
MKTVRIAMDDELVAKLDDVVRQQGTRRAEFTSQALRAALEGSEQMERVIRDLEQRRVLSSASKKAKRELKSLVKKPGALRRFLDSRD